MKVINKLFNSGLKETIGTVFEGIDSISTSREEKAALRAQALDKIIADRNSARDMYSKDNVLQKLFALFFLIIWATILAGMLYYFIFTKIELSDWQIAFINTIWGGISMKLSTIVDFLFGSSEGQKDITRK